MLWGGAKPRVVHQVMLLICCMHRGLPSLLGIRFWSVAAVVAVLLAGCGSEGGNASLGPDPGGGFYCPHNAFEGCVGP